ncbi:MAG: tetratricopeptide repeat protein [Symploca sp. SIO2C1]|nr:tetratricopeptide repeat protein [Symploca sp. SIO2C1]
MVNKRIRRILIILSAVSFFGSTGFVTVSLFKNSSKHAQENTTTAGTSKDDQLQVNEQGYQLVLQREPENQVALNGLVETRLQMNDVQGAIKPLEKLVQLNPDRSDYKAQLDQLKSQVGDN